MVPSPTEPSASSNYPINLQCVNDIFWYAFSLPVNHDGLTTSPHLAFRKFPSTEVSERH